ncbi:hypothetical protein BD770DRAFT_398335 [Pilaira anomala]|nr:hypothetical protein BD770DRAFT_398335 [Pilaira anomala]
MYSLFVKKRKNCAYAVLCNLCIYANNKAVFYMQAFLQAVSNSCFNELFQSILKHRLLREIHSKPVLKKE